VKGDWNTEEEHEVGSYLDSEMIAEMMQQTYDA
jgi:hypothetical protein